jgi:hypothetical protein
MAEPQLLGQHAAIILAARRAPRKQTMPKGRMAAAAAVAGAASDCHPKLFRGAGWV